MTCPAYAGTSLPDAETSSQHSEKRRPLGKDHPRTAFRYVRRCTRANQARHGAGATGQLKALDRWAVISYNLLPSGYLDCFERFPPGGEHEIFHDAKNSLAIKVTHLGSAGWTLQDGGRHATVLEYLNRLSWHDYLFKVSIRLVGLITRAGAARIVTSAPWVTEKCTSDRITTEDEVTQYMGSLGFRQVPIPKFMYLHRELGIVIGDAHPGNFIKVEGVLVPIDLMIHEDRSITRP